MKMSMLIDNNISVINTLNLVVIWRQIISNPLYKSNTKICGLVSSRKIKSTKIYDTQRQNSLYITEREDDLDKNQW